MKKSITAPWKLVAVALLVGSVWIGGMAACKLLERGFEPPVFVSANCDGADEHNKPLLEFVRERIRGL